MNKRELVKNNSNWWNRFEGYVGTREDRRQNQDTIGNRQVYFDLIWEYFYDNDILFSDISEEDKMTILVECDFTWSGQDNTHRKNKIRGILNNMIEYNQFDIDNKKLDEDIKSSDIDTLLDRIDQHRIDLYNIIKEIHHLREENTKLKDKIEEQHKIIMGIDILKIQEYQTRYKSE